MVKKIGLRRIDNRALLDIGNESIEIADYQIKSSADGTTELAVIITGLCSEIAISVNLKEKEVG